MSGHQAFRGDPLGLRGSRDPATGDVYYPPRAFAADGSLRRCEPVELSGHGVLYAWTELGGTIYGQVDLPEGVRIVTRLAPGSHAIGATYSLEADPEHNWRFRRA